MTSPQTFPDIRACVVSYPKTGRTWLRIMIGHYLCTLRGLAEKNIPRTEALTKACGLLQTRFTHGRSSFDERIDYRALDPDRSWFRGRKVLLLGRDARDTLVSAYFWATRKLRIFDGSISDFVRDGTLGAPKFFTFYRHWLDARHVPREILFLRYEDMHQDPAAALTSALEFLGAQRIDGTALRASVDYASFENLRRIESAGRYRTTTLTDSALRSAAPEEPKFRRGKVGTFNEYLSAEDVEWIDAINASLGCEFTRS